MYIGLASLQGMWKITDSLPFFRLRFAPKSESIRKRMRACRILFAHEKTTLPFGKFAVTSGRRPNHVGLTRKYGCRSEIAIEPDLVVEESTAAMVLVRKPRVAAVTSAKLRGPQPPLAWTGKSPG